MMLNYEPIHHTFFTEATSNCDSFSSCLNKQESHNSFPPKMLLKMPEEIHSQLKRLNEAHDELLRLKEELIQNFSHELQTPLALISGYAELMLSGEWGPVASEHLQALSTILSQSKALSARVEDMVSLRTIYAGRLKIEEFSLGALIEDTLLDFLNGNQDLGRQFETIFHTVSDKVKADRSFIGQALNILIGNAIKFSQKGSTIRVIVHERQDSLVVKIKDQGIGIPAEKTGRVFESFYQLDGSASRRFGGLGLGLAVAKRIVDVHGGQIWADSAAQEAGCAVCFSLHKCYPDKNIANKPLADGR